MTKTREQILVIRLGAIGDLIFCFQSFHEMRLAHADADLILLTRSPFAAFARSLPWFNSVIVETHPTYRDLPTWLNLRKQIRALAPSRVYDLQGKRRQTILYGLLGGPWGPAWSGAAPLCKFPRPWPPKIGMHFTDFLAAQLRAAGIPSARTADLSWLTASVDKFNLPDLFIVLVPGCSPTAPHKRWPSQHFAEVANKFRAQGICSIAIGTKADAGAIAEIKKEAAHIVDLCDQTSLFELAGIMRRSYGVIGNDTGPVHLAAAIGAPTVAVFSGRSSPVWSAPPGKHVAVVQRSSLDDLSAGEVIVALNLLKEKALRHDQ